MAPLIHLDTHVVVWLYAGRTELIPEPRRRDLNAAARLEISPAVLLELAYLHEIGRTTVGADEIVDALATEIGLALCTLPFADVARAALGRSWTRDPFDRLLVSQADLRGAPLLTRDETLLRHYPRAIWDG